MEHICREMKQHSKINIFKKFELPLKLCNTATKCSTSLVIKQDNRGMREQLAFFPTPANDLAFTRSSWVILSWSSLCGGGCTCWYFVPLCILFLSLLLSLHCCFRSLLALFLRLQLLRVGYSACNPPCCVVWFDFGPLLGLVVLLNYFVCIVVVVIVGLSRELARTIS